MNIFDIFPNVQFYDYTKIYKRYDSTIPNYHLTWSYSQANKDYAKDYVALTNYNKDYGKTYTGLTDYNKDYDKDYTGLLNYEKDEGK